MVSRVNSNSLQMLMRAQGVSQSEIARRIGVSRQAVSLWLKQPDQIHVTGKNLVLTARALGRPVERLIEPLPLRDPQTREQLQARLLWDRIFVSLEDLAIAVARKEPRAIARLVEVHGLYAAAKLAGSAAVWRGFSRYKRVIPPVRRRQLECLVRWKTNRQAS